VAIERALISVFDKTGIVEFARALASIKVEIISTGGTAQLLRQSGIPVRDIAELTGWPEMLGGRVKTLHPKVHGGILFRRDKSEHREEAKRHEIAPIDLVVVNLYPFSATAAKPGVTPDELIENIDIGGPSMVRSAAKNFQSVGVVTDPGDYSAIADELREKGELSLGTRLALVRKAFARTARYDGEIATELERLAADGMVAMNARSNGNRRCGTAKIHTKPRRCTFRRGRRQQDWRAQSNWGAKSFPTTTWWTWMRLGGWCWSFSSRPWPSSSTTIRAELRNRHRSARHT
jgi:AICAR transformylase/IMP cyclohydrolase PurH